MGNPQIVSADFDQDGDTDGADFLGWQRGFGITGGAERHHGDANVDGSVNGLDLGVWQTQFGGNSAGFASLATERGENKPAPIQHASLLTGPSTPLLEPIIGLSIPIKNSPSAEPTVLADVVFEEAWTRAAGDTASLPSRTIFSRLDVNRPDHLGLLQSAESGASTVPSLDAAFANFDDLLSTLPSAG